jgi:hypothetical protein
MTAGILIGELLMMCVVLRIGPWLIRYGWYDALAPAQRLLRVLELLMLIYVFARPDIIRRRI